MKCKHPIKTLCSDEIEGELFAIWQCDLCGMTLPLSDVPDVGNLLDLPPVDYEAVDRRFFILFQSIIKTPCQLTPEQEHRVNAVKQAVSEVIEDRKEYA